MLYICELRTLISEMSEDRHNTERAKPGSSEAEWRCRAITNDGTPCQNRRWRRSYYCFQHYPKRLLISSVALVVLGAVLSFGIVETYDAITLSREEQLLEDQKGVIDDLEDRNEFLEEQLEELSGLVKVTPEGNIVIGKPYGGSVNVAPGAKLTISPNPAFACNLGIEYLREEKIAAAREMFESAIEADSTYYLSYLYLSMTLLMADDFGSAEPFAEQAIAYLPEEPQKQKLVYLISGLILKAQDKNDAAIRRFNQALSADPDFSLARDAMRRINEPISFPLFGVQVTVP